MVSSIHPKLCRRCGGYPMWYLEHGMFKIKCSDCGNQSMWAPSQLQAIRDWNSADGELDIEEEDI